MANLRKCEACGKSELFEILVDGAYNVTHCAGCGAGLKPEPLPAADPSHTKYFKFTRDWEHFEPYNDGGVDSVANGNAFHVPHFDSWRCIVQPLDEQRKEKGVEQGVQILFFTDESNYENLHTFNAIVHGLIVLQMAEQYNGVWCSMNIRQLHSEDGVCNWLYNLVKAKLDELGIEPTN